jgi:Ca2+-binding RTX toxin-like protein
MPSISGTDGNDSLLGTSSADTILGGAGNDTLVSGGSVTFWDILRGEDGDDSLVGGSKASLSGGAGDDRLVDARLGYGGSGNDTISGSSTPPLGGDVWAFDGWPLHGAELHGYTGDDVITGSGDSDEIYGGSGQNVLNGGEGSDVFFVLDVDLIYDTTKFSFIIPFDTSTFTLQDLGGELGSTRSHTIDGGAGDDRVDATNFLGAVIIDLAAGTFVADAFAYNPSAFVGATNAVLTSVESAYGGRGADLIRGTSASNTLAGGVGADTIFGGAGDDRIVDADWIDIGGGISVRAEFGDSNYLRGEEGNDYIEGGNGDDDMGGGVGNDTISDEWSGGSNFIRGDDGDDSLTGGVHFDDLHGNMGNDTVVGGNGDDWVVGGKDQDLLYGGNGLDIVLGNLGNDTCYGGAGRDVVRGGQADDLVYGEAGSDYISGDRGNDTVYGGAGADWFHGSQDQGVDRIMDFNIAEGDRLLLDPGTIYTVDQSGSDVVINMGGGNYMVLVGAQLSSLGSGWIVESHTWG